MKKRETFGGSDGGSGAILDGGAGTGAVTRVLIETADGKNRWTTVGVHENVIAASWLALEDAINYGLLAN